MKLLYHNSRYDTIVSLQLYKGETKMYHIKPDKRSRTSARLISEGLLECMKKKDFTQITITDLQRTSGVGRSTFYRLFDNISDVLAYMCDMQFEKIMENANQIPTENADEFMLMSIRSWMESIDLIKALASSNRLDLLFSSSRNSLEQAKELYAERFGNGHQMLMTDREREYILSGMLCAMMGILAVWVQRGRQETPEELLRIINSSFQGLMDVAAAEKTI